MEYGFFLGELLKKRYETIHSWKAISEYIEKRTGTHVDRRKLQALAEHEYRSLKIQELLALWRYFVDNKEISPHENFIFRIKESLLDGFTEDDVHIYFPSRYIPSLRTDGSSRFDLQAVEALVSSPEIQHARRVSLHDVFYHGSGVQPLLQDRPLDDQWVDVFNTREVNTAIISIGSPYVSYASELALCRIMGVAPYEPVYGDNDVLPFYFYWPRDTTSDHSAFTMNYSQVKSRFPGKLDDFDRKEDRALVLGDEFHVARRIGTSPNLLVAQFINGHLVIVISAIYAPATLGIAKCLVRRELRSLSSHRDGQLQPVLIAIIETQIGIEEEQEVTKKDLRRLDSAKVAYCELWECSDGRWQVRN